ncbi:MAG: hypothetical protein V1837_04270 [Candidatus Woesearchaeota archaeon]
MPLAVEEQIANLSRSIEALHHKIDKLDLNSTHQLIHSQHSYIFKALKDFEEKVTNILQQTGQQGEAVNAIRAARNDIIREMRESVVFDKSSGKDELTAALRDTVRLLREQKR